MEVDVKSLVAAVVLSIVSVSCVTHYDVEYYYDGEQNLTERQLDRKLSKDLAHCEMNSSYTHTGSSAFSRDIIVSQRAVDENVFANCMYTRDWVSNYVEAK